MSVLDNLLKIENNKELFQFSFTYKNILMYPFIRFVLFQNAIEDIQKVPSPYDPSNIKILQKINYVIKSICYRPQNIQSDIIFFGSDISNIRQGGAYFNRLTESFANQYIDRTILIEKPDKGNYKRPRTYHKVFARTNMSISAKIKSKLSSVKPEDINRIDMFLQYLKKEYSYKFHNDKVWKSLKDILFHFAKELPFLCKGYSELLEKLSPKIVFIEDACYGGDKLPLIIAARELKIPIVEYQHGLISLAHPAYNYSTQILKCYKYFMPDFYMSYGRYWTENSRLPIKVLEIGNPYLSDTVSGYNKGEKQNTVLYISSAINPEIYAKEVLQLSASLATNHILLLFRIHPSETNRLETVYKPIIDAGITIDTEPLYETLKTTKYIFGDYSTVLFEASLFDCIIFVRDDAYNRANIDITRFNAVSSINKMVEKVTSGKYKYTEHSDFWADDWRERYKKFISSFIKQA